MRILTLDLTSFRNIEQQSVAPGPRVNLVVGSNGQGKTNLVEAVTFLSWLKSFRSSRTVELIGRGAEAAGVAATVEGRDGVRDLRIGIGHGFRRGTLDGRAVRSSRDTLAALTVACLSPDDPAVLEGGPEGRRTLLDRFVTLLRPERSAVLGRYARLVRERNHVLRAEPGQWDEGVLRACEEALAATGAEVVADRKEALSRLLAELPATLAGMWGGDMRVRVAYLSRWLPAGATSAETVIALRERLQARRPADAAVGYTTDGPHADDVDVELLGLKARGHASRGQRKVLMLAWKAAEARVFASERGEDPVLVLDDALADLDGERQERVVSFLTGYGGQSFVTGAALPDAVLACGAVFRAADGTFTRM